MSSNPKATYAGVSEVTKVQKAQLTQWETVSKQVPDPDLKRLNTPCSSYSSSSQSVALGSTAPTSPGNVIEMHILRPRLDQLTQKL